MQLACSVRRMDDEVTVVLAGESDLATLNELRDALFDAVAERPSRVVVDLRGLIFIDSMSISALIAARRAALEHDTQFVVVHPRGQVLKVLGIAGVLDVLTAGQPADGDVVGGVFGTGLGA
jgi:anti-sigma B factor antagonist